VTQYEIVYEDTCNGHMTTINYGILEKILVCSLGQDEFWRGLEGRDLILAAITPFKTNGHDAAVETVFYNACAPMVVTDLRNIKSVIGRVKTRKSWGLIDRSLVLAHAKFVDDDSEYGSAQDED
jgi:hypothetical protein